MNIEDPISSDYGNLELLFYGSFLPVPSPDKFKGKNELTDASNDVQMSNDNDRESESIYPGKIIPFKKLLAQNDEDGLDEGEIENENQSPSEENQTQHLNGVDDKFIEINKDKGESVLLSVTNLSNQIIKVVLLKPLIKLLIRFNQCFIFGQIGSHFNFIEANKFLQFDRSLAYGMRLVNMSIMPFSTIWR